MAEMVLENPQIKGIEVSAFTRGFAVSVQIVDEEGQESHRTTWTTDPMNTRSMVEQLRLAGWIVHENDNSFTAFRNEAEGE